MSKLKIISLHSFWMVNIIIWNYIRCDEYLGCFQDAIPSVILKEKSETNVFSATIPWCHTVCEDSGLMYAGLRTGITCLCDSVLHANLSEIQLPDTDCSIKCSGNSSSFCGGVFKTSLYHLDLPLSITENMSTSNFLSMDTTSDLSTKSTENDTQSLTTIHYTQPSGNQSSIMGTNVAQSTVTTTMLSTEYASMETTGFLPSTTRQQKFTISDNSTCSCVCIDVTADEFIDKLKHLVQNITIDKKQTSMYIRSKISVYESRMSSTTIGVAGILFVTLIIALVLAADIHTFCNKKMAYQVKIRNTIHHCE